MIQMGDYPKPIRYSQAYLEAIRDLIWLKLILKQSEQSSDQVNVENFTDSFSIYRSVFSILRSYLEKHPETIEKLKNEKISFQIYDAKQMPDTKQIQKQCFRDGRTCWINVLSDVTVDQVDAFFRMF